MKHGKDLTFEDTAPVGTSAKTLRTVFCDGDDRALVSAAQREATRECQHPQQSKPLPTEPFEPHGMN